MKTKRHHHEQSMWFIAGGYWMWCYKCGAIRPTTGPDAGKWQKPVGMDDTNPALKEKKCNPLSANH